AHLIAGTDRADGPPVFSPDGRWIAFVKGASLVKVPIDGGVPIPIAQVRSTITSSFWGADWSSDSTLVYAAPSMKNSNVAALFRVSAAGGSTEEVAVPAAERGETGFGWPQRLPDGQHVLVSIRKQTWQSGAVGVVSMADRKTQVLLENATYGR